MIDRYKAEFDDENIFGPGMCAWCGKKGYHDECRIKAESTWAKYQEADKSLLSEYSIKSAYGPSGIDGLLSYDEAVSILEKVTGHTLNCCVDNCIENERWWYIDHTWIGCIGYIVEKDTKKVFCLGSAWGQRDKTPFQKVHWCGIKAYVRGDIHAEKSS